MSDEIEKTVDLGWPIARIKMSGENLCLDIITPISVDSNGYVPACSIVVVGSENIVRLRKFLGDVKIKKSFPHRAKDKPKSNGINIGFK